jgi:5-methylcytosine-specific restriction protein A
MTAKLSNPAAAKNPRKVWYGLQQWKVKRAHQLRVEPLCAICQAEGRITGATVADHVEPHKGNYTAFIMGPLRSLCAACHDNLSGFTHKPYDRKAIGADGFPLDPRHPFNARR